MKIEFRTDAYERTHGKMPKGNGYWGFSTNPNGDPNEFKFFSGTLAEAKRQAKEYYKKVAQQICESWMIIYILP